jgi:hypothetical protein
MEGAMYIFRLQIAGTTYQLKIYLQKYSTGNIKSLKINLIKLIYTEFHQTVLNQHQIRNFVNFDFQNMGDGEIVKYFQNHIRMFQMAI